MSPAAEASPKAGLSVVVPAYNEEMLIEDMVTDLLETGRRWTGALEVIIVNDGSSDRTAEIIDRLAREHEGVRAMHQTQNRGFGAAVRMGLENAAHDLVTFCPADHRFSDKEFEVYLTLIKHADAVIGYRRERRRHQKLYPWLVSQVYHALVNVLFCQDLYDVNWIHMYHRDQLPDFLGASDGVFFLAETIIRAKRRGLNVVGVDVGYARREAGGATGRKPGTIVETLREMAVFFFKRSSA